MNKENNKKLKKYKQKYTTGGRVDMSKGGRVSLRHGGSHGAKKAIGEPRFLMKNLH